MVGTLRRHRVTRMIKSALIHSAIASAFASGAFAFGLPDYPLVPGEAKATLPVPLPMAVPVMTRFSTLAGRV